MERGGADRCSGGGAGGGGGGVVNATCYRHCLIVTSIKHFYLFYRRYLFLYILMFLRFSCVLILVAFLLFEFWCTCVRREILTSFVVVESNRNKKKKDASLFEYSTQLYFFFFFLFLFLLLLGCLIFFSLVKRNGLSQQQQHQQETKTICVCRCFISASYLKSAIKRKFKKRIVIILKVSCLLY